MTAARRLRAHTRTVLEPFGLTPSTARALEMVSRHGPVRVSTLAEHLRVAPRTATELIDDLEQRGLAARRPDPGDRRAVLVELTAAGERATGDIRAARDAAGERFFAVLDEADRRDLARILRRLRD